MQHALCGKGLFISAVEISMKPVRNSGWKPLAGRQGDICKCVVCRALMTLEEWLLNIRSYGWITRYLHTGK